jgi:ribosomal protein S8
MAHSGWPASKVMVEHLQNLISQGYITSVDIATGRVLEDHVSPASVGGYVMACVAFYG